MDVLLEVVASDVRDGDDDLVDVGEDLGVQGAPHPRRLGSRLEVRLLLVILLDVLKCKTELWAVLDPRRGRNFTGCMQQ